jgi:hypothetical protein
MADTGQIRAGDITNQTSTTSAHTSIKPATRKRVPSTRTHPDRIPVPVFQCTSQFPPSSSVIHTITENPVQQFSSKIPQQVRPAEPQNKPEKGNQ